ncbi:uncharacterized protein LOC136034346 [Artemia franciscana]|uniref:uncharacterized protein LOC136034346 n=1 Tax=Artemia franciscana TaxID=6661 RepID=UPI0032DBD0C2
MTNYVQASTGSGNIQNKDKIATVSLSLEAEEPSQNSSKETDADEASQAGPNSDRYEADPCPESSRIPLSTLSPVAYNAKKRFPTFLLCNARSLCNKIDEIDVVLRQNNVSVAAITETWNLTEVTGRLTGYALYLRTRQALGDQRLGGGVALYVREDIPMKELRELESTEHEAVWVWCKPSAMPRAHSCIIFASIYYPESAKNRRDLVKHLQKTVDHLRAFYGNPAIVLAGDFNQTKKSWLALCLSLKQVVNFPTHESGSILDLILTNCETYYQTPESLGPLACSDHNIVLWSAAASTPKPKIKRVNRWIATYPFPEVYGDKSPNKKCQLFNEILHAKDLEFFPEKIFTRCESDKPWITPKIKKLIQKKCKLFQEGDLQNAKKLRNHITSLTRSAKKDYGREKFSDSLRHTNPRKWHRAVKQITGKSIHNSIKISHPDGTYTTVDEVNQYFTHIWTSFPSPTQAQKSEILDSCADEGEVVIDEMTTYKTLMKVKANCSAYPDELPTQTDSRIRPLSLRNNSQC